ncbi:MAG: aminoacyl-tRNA hydrolase [Dehalococcoidales bacterium]|nr:aminoacyl-tRNA hydrolase [Dehalococcoidales bacterium]
MKLIVGLGNPGLAYSNSRHNIGFMCISRFARQHKINFDKKQGKARVGLGKVAGQPVVLARPQTYMNASGEAVGYLADRYKVEMDDLIVIHDDMDLPLGKIRIRQGGRSAGHKGIDSIIYYLDKEDFIRVRVGIGRPEPTEDKGAEVIDFVLDGFSDNEVKTIAPVISRVSDAILCLITEGLETAMNKYNRYPKEKSAT